MSAKIKSFIVQKACRGKAGGMPPAEFQKDKFSPFPHRPSRLNEEASRELTGAVLQPCRRGCGVENDLKSSEGDMLVQWREPMKSTEGR